MTQERFQQIRGLFCAALELGDSERDAYVERACPDDESVRVEVQRLLRSHQIAGRFLQQDSSATTSTWVPAQDELVGRFLKDRYRVVRELGRGGFGVVFLADDTQLHDKPVVVKVLREKLDSADWFHKKFRQECEALARISHPGVVGVLDQGETAEGMPFLVMEIVAGRTLQAALSAGAMELKRVAGLLRQVGQALDVAHKHGVYHRDLKPANIMLRDVGGGEEVPVIIDFGVATVQDSQSTSGLKTRVAGTYPYMAPEQILGHPESASDIYALGVIAYELVTGRRPFEESGPVQLYFQQKEGTKVLPRQLRPQLPEAAQQVILKTLSFNPADRYARALDVGEEFSQALAVERVEAEPTTEDAPAPPVPALLTRRIALAAATTAGVGTVAWSAGWFRGEKSPPAATAERSLAYYIVVQRYRQRQPYLEPFRLAGEMIFPPGYGIRLIISSAQEGWLYLVNEGPEGGLNLLFPTPATNAGSARLAANREIQAPPGDAWLMFDEQQGEEKLWIVWSREAVAELEAVTKWVNEKDRGSIRDEAQAAAVRGLLLKHSAARPRVEKDEAGKRTLLRGGSGDILTHALKLEHR